MGREGRGELGGLMKPLENFMKTKATPHSGEKNAKKDKHNGHTNFREIIDSHEVHPSLTDQAFLI